MLPWLEASLKESTMALLLTIPRKDLFKEPFWDIVHIVKYLLSNKSFSTYFILSSILFKEYSLLSFFLSF